MTATSDLLALLQRHYIKPGADLPGGVFLPEVGQNGSWGASNRCDAIYVGFTTSSGRLLVGHELKVSRADWLSELNKPGKADMWADQCHEWWLVVNDPAIVRDGELPPGWGILHPGRSKTRMQVHTAAARKDATHRPSWDAVRSVLARQDSLRAQAVTDAVQKKLDGVRRGAHDEAVRSTEARLARRPEAEMLEQRLKIVEETLGAPIDWSDDDVPRRGHIDLDLLHRLGEVTRAVGVVELAAHVLTNGYANPIKSTREALDRLDAALSGLGSVSPKAAGDA